MKVKVSITLDQDVINKIDDVLFKKIAKVKKASDLNFINRSYVINEILREYFNL